MKLVLSAIVVLFSLTASAVETKCFDVNAKTLAANEAVKSLLAVADAPNVMAYYGGVQSESEGVTVVNVQPHYQHTKDWYKVSVRNSDCRVLEVYLFQESLPNLSAL